MRHDYRWMEVFAAIKKPRFLWQLTMDISGSSAWALKHHFMIFHGGFTGMQNHELWWSMDWFCWDLEETMVTSSATIGRGFRTHISPVLIQLDPIGRCLEREPMRDETNKSRDFTYPNDDFTGNMDFTRKQPGFWRRSDSGNEKHGIDGPFSSMIYLLKNDDSP